MYGVLSVTHKFRPSCVNKGMIPEISANQIPKSADGISTVGFGMQK